MPGGHSVWRMYLSSQQNWRSWNAVLSCLHLPSIHIRCSQAIDLKPQFPFYKRMKLELEEEKEICIFHESVPVIFQCADENWEECSAINQERKQPSREVVIRKTSGKSCTASANLSASSVRGNEKQPMKRHQGDDTELKISLKYWASWGKRPQLFLLWVCGQDPALGRESACSGSVGILRALRWWSFHGCL